MFRRKCETSVLTRATRHNNPEDGILHNHSRENVNLNIFNLFKTYFNTVRHQRLGVEDAILHSHRRGNLKSYIALTDLTL
jgi:hypothetical protein